MRRGLLAGLVVALVMVAVPAARGAEPDCVDWPMYGHDLDHSFSQDPGCAAIDTLNVRTLVPKWVVPTKDSVTASPSVVDGRVYVGGWDGTFYSIDAGTGKVLWKFAVDDTKKVGFGRIVSSAAVADFAEGGDKRKVVLFGGGSTLYALDALTGARLASVDLDPREPDVKARQAASPPDVEIESSPAVVGDRVFIGMDVHNRAATGRTGLVSLRLANTGPDAWAFEPQWKFDPETSAVYTGPGLLTEGSGQGFGCGGVWSSPAIDTAQGLIFFGTANCNNVEEARAASENWAESTYAIRLDTGALVWKYRPAEADFDTVEEQNAEAHADDDFGASPNILRLLDGRTLWGNGRKSATYYAFDTGSDRTAPIKPLWETKAGQSGRVGENFSIGGFLGTPAVQRDDDGKAVRVVGATAVPIPDQSDFPGSIDRSTWAVRAMDPETGKIQWVHRLGAPAYGAPTIANGVVFVPNTFTATLQALDAETGLLLWAGAVPPSSSAPAVVGDSVYLGGGTRETDAEYKSFRDTGLDTQALASVVGPHPLSPASGIFAFELAGS